MCKIETIEKGNNKMDIMKLMKIKGAWEKFQKNHPKFMPFINAISQNGITEGTIMELTVTTPEGKTLSTNIKVQASDLELLEQIKAMAK